MSKHSKTADAIEILRIVHRADPKMEQMIAEEQTHQVVAQQIYDLRTHHKLTQRQLADCVGTTQSVIARLEDADYAGHSLTMLSRIGLALGYVVSVSFVPVKATGIKSGRHSATVPKPPVKIHKVAVSKRTISKRRQAMNKHIHAA